MYSGDQVGIAHCLSVQLAAWIWGWSWISEDVDSWGISVRPAQLVRSMSLQFLLVADRGRYRIWIIHIHFDPLQKTNEQRDILISHETESRDWHVEAQVAPHLFTFFLFLSFHLFFLFCSSSSPDSSPTCTESQCAAHVAPSLYWWIHFKVVSLRLNRVWTSIVKSVHHRKH